MMLVSELDELTFDICGKFQHRRELIHSARQLQQLRDVET
jgi:hypothetical protein